ncbi:MAG: S9 family peptidase, partial [Planctomycetes bacterium]|nr:S9 family peptidase [Planctomycetota bacterium]
MAGKRRLALDDLFKMKAVGRVAISPDGQRIVFELTRFDLKKNKNFTQLMLVEAERGPARPARPLTDGEQSDSRPKWSPDGSRLAFISNREKASCLYVLPMDGGEPKRITTRDGNVRDFDFSPNGRRLAYTWQPMTDRQKLERDGKADTVATQPQYKHITRLFHKLDGAGYWNGQYTHVWVISADGGKPKQLTRGNYDDREPRFSPNGKLISFVSNRLDDPDRDWDQSDIFVVKPAGGPIRRVTRATGYCDSHSWSPDGAAIAFVGSPCRPRQWYKHDDHLWIVSAGGGKPRELTRGIDKQCTNSTGGDVVSAAYDTSPPIWSGDSTRVFFQVSEQGATRVYSVRAGGGRRDPHCIIGGDLNVMRMQRTAREGPLALVIGHATNPADVHVADLSVTPAKTARLSDVNRRLLSQVDLTQPERFTVKSGRATIEGWVIKPPGFRKGRNYPAILEIHGGPESQYGHAFYHELHWLAAKDYVVVYANPRGSSGYG